MDAARDLDPALFERGFENRLQAVLRQHEHTAAQIDLAFAGRTLEQTEPVDDAPVGGQSASEALPFEHLQRVGVEDERVAVHRSPAAGIEDLDVDARGLEIQGGHHADRTGPDHHDFRLVLLGHVASSEEGQA
jgi:hypothetical protein